MESSALHLLRRQAVRAVRGGMLQTDAAHTFGASLRAISKWMRLDREGGLQAFTLKRRGRRPGEGRLSGKRAARIRLLIVGKLPDQLTLPFYLWTRAAVASLIAREYGIAVSLVTVGRYLRAWGLSPQKPVWRANERNDAAIARWLKQEYPAIAGRPGGTRQRSTGATRRPSCMIFRGAGGSSSGRTSAFGADYRGSNPRPPANLYMRDLGTSAHISLTHHGTLTFAA